MTDGPERVLHPIVYGDEDPEDAWDASDPLLHKVIVIRKWVANLEDNVASGDYVQVRERFRKLDARATIGALLRLHLPDDTRVELEKLDERLDDVDP